MKIVDFSDNEALPAVFAAISVAVLVGGAWLLLSGPQPAAPPLPLSQEQAQYQRAVNLAVWPNPATVSTSLVQLKSSDTLVTWTNAAYVGSFKGPQLTRLTWVTAQPHLQQFCQQFEKVNGPDQDLLNLRLKQRLGLPPGAAYDTFVEFNVAPQDFSKIFRPCGTWDPTTPTCNAVTGADVWNPPAGLKPEALDWLVKNHYSSYATGQPYPWTALGYTFDWALQDPTSDDFVRDGESEFVVPANTSITFVSSASTADYCKAP
jgi:hypothetical protein